MLKRIAPRVLLPSFLILACSASDYVHGELQQRERALEMVFRERVVLFRKSQCMQHYEHHKNGTELPEPEMYDAAIRRVLSRPVVCHHCKGSRCVKKYDANARTVSIVPCEDCAGTNVGFTLST